MEHAGNDPNCDDAENNPPYDSREAGCGEGSVRVELSEYDANHFSIGAPIIEPYSVQLPS
jgi:hypothetical protein